VEVAFRIKRQFKFIVTLLEKVLPDPVFKAVLSFGFPKYKAIIRFLYIVSGFILYKQFNGEKWIMVKRIHSIMPYTLVGIGGLEATYRLATMMNDKGIPGDYVELGVAKGGCAALMGKTTFDKSRRQSIERRLRLFDSFEGLPEPTENDYSDAGADGTGYHLTPLSKGSCTGTLEEVKYLLFDVCGFPKKRVIFIKGWFESTVPAECHRMSKIAILRIDGDWYQSTKTCLEGLYDFVVSGGAVIVDDYLSCYGCKKAVDEFMKNRGIYSDIVLDGRGGCYFFKP